MPNIVTRAEKVPWLSAIGSIVPTPSSAYRPSLDEWRYFVGDAVGQEFGLGRRGDSRTPIDQVVWLGEDGPNPNSVLAQRLPQLMAQPSFREQKLTVSRIVLRGLRTIPASPWLVVGGTDFRAAVRKAAPFIFRMALAEEHGDCIGFWHTVVSVFEQGFCPVGVLPDDRLVVL